MATQRRTSHPNAVKLLGGSVGPRQVRVIASDATPDRMGDVLVPSGVVLDNYRRNPVVLAQHDPTAPIGRCASIGVEGAQLVALIEFPPVGVSALADEYCGLLKAGILAAVSVGFLPLASEPIPRAGLRFTSWEILELSVVSIPANPSALVTERGFGDPGAAGRLQRALALQQSLDGPMRHVYDRSEAELAANARSLALGLIRSQADLTTAAGRAAHARRLARHYAADAGAPATSRAAVIAEARWRTSPRW